VIEETDRADVSDLDELAEENGPSDLEKRQGACKAYSLFWGRGTLEPSSSLGMVGRPLASALGSEWYVEDIKYDNDKAGIDCIGLPGGVLFKKQIEAHAARCPKTRIVAGGYSQGAMAARIGVAFSNDNAKKQVAVSVDSRRF
jgi:hypothetical protein